MKHRVFCVTFILFTFVFMFFLFGCSFNAKPTYIFNEGEIHGTSYHIIYFHPDSIDLHQKIKQRMQRFDASLSTYQENSIISKINRNENGVKADEMVLNVVNRAMEISGNTKGAFDITVAPLVNAWGFGFTEKSNIDSTLIDSLLNYVGYQKIHIEKNDIIKEDPHIMLDVNAIAKGYSVDLVAEFLEDNNILNYMVEIGGEVRTQGKNPKGFSWRIGIDKPIDDPYVRNRELQEVIQVSGQSVATSGNYRRFYIKDGQKFAHTIDPITGYPVKHNLLSATVVGYDCMTADAYATAFMVMGLEKSVDFVNSHKDFEVYFIYTDESGLYKVYYSPGFKKRIIEQ